VLGFNVADNGTTDISNCVFENISSVNSTGGIRIYLYNYGSGTGRWLIDDCSFINATV
jgi:hypothetical protein